jgi:superfamily I DNA/RNA helicase
VTWLVPREDLTPDQVEAIEFDPGQGRLVVGGPGSGKTQILLHRARHLLNVHRVSPDRFRVFVFTRALRDYLQAEGGLLDLPAESVTTLDAWCLEYHKKHIPGKAPWNVKAKAPDFPAIRDAVLLRLRDLPSRERPLDFALVDEAQDLDADALALIQAAAHHVTACMDRRQQIYEGRATEAEVLSRLGIPRRSVSLLSGFRCSSHLLRVANALTSEGPGLRNGGTAVVADEGDRETPILHYAEDIEDEKRRLLELLRVRLSLGDRVGILLPLNRQVYGFQKWLAGEGIEAETTKNLDFASEAPKLLTLHSSKGLTFDSVLIPRLSAVNLPQGEQATRLVYVGITRATRWAYLATSRHKPLPALKAVAALAPVVSVEGTLSQVDLLAFAE